MVRRSLLGINIDSISEDEVYDRIMKLTEVEKTSKVILLDTHLLMRAVFNKELKAIINSADLVIPISKNIKKALRFLKTEIEKTYNFFSFTIRLINKSCDFHKFLYFLGGKKNQMKRIEKNIKDSFPGVRTVGVYHTRYKKDFEKKLITAMQKAGPHIVIVSMKRPRMEKWINSRIQNFKTGVFIGVEDFIEIVAGKKTPPSDESIERGWYSLSKILRNPFGFLRVFEYFLFYLLVLVEKIRGH